jgi:hypothetical protein
MMHERAEYRIEYPLMSQPVLRLDTRARHESRPKDHAPVTECAVIDLSESGMRFESPLAPEIRAGEKLAGTLVLAQQAKRDVSGVCLRVEDQQCIVLLDRASRIPISFIFEEQRVLRARYPGWR